MGVVPAGEEVRAVVTAVKVWSNTAEPLIVTVPDRVGAPAAVTVNVGFTVVIAPLLPLMVMVGLYVPAANPAFGCTVNVLVCPLVNAVVQFAPATSV